MERGFFQLKDISILIPTRGRTQALETSIMSLVDNADDPSRLEIFFAFDDDDTGSSTWCVENILPRLDEHDIEYHVMEFKRLGYIRLNEYINEMAKSATGRWLFFWTDDTIMNTAGWDTIVANHDRFRLLRIPSHNQHPYAIVPIIPREWFELFGYMSPHQLTDTWVSQISYMLDIVEHLPVDVTHDRYDLTGNNFDDTWKNRPMLEGNTRDPRDFNHISWRERRVQDCDKIANYLEKQGEDMSWWRNVQQGKQDPWTKMISKELDPNGQVSRIK